MKRVIAHIDIYEDGTKEYFQDASDSYYRNPAAMVSQPVVHHGINSWLMVFKRKVTRLFSLFQRLPRPQQSPCRGGAVDAILNKSVNAQSQEPKSDG